MTVSEQARALASLPPLSMPCGNSAEQATNGLLHSMYMMPPDALCGLSAALGTHEFNLHFGTMRATPIRDSGQGNQLFAARVKRKQQTEAYKLVALEAQIDSIRKALG
jgi:hypothetical protein